MEVENRENNPQLESEPSPQEQVDLTDPEIDPEITIEQANEQTEAASMDKSDKANQEQANTNSESENDSQISQSSGQEGLSNPLPGQANQASGDRNSVINEAVIGDNNFDKTENAAAITEALMADTPEERLENLIN